MEIPELNGKQFSTPVNMELSKEIEMGEKD
jgi:hypothetical protein